MKSILLILLFVQKISGDNYRFAGGLGFGYLEVFRNQTWHQICDPNFGDGEATATCQYFGYESAAQLTHGPQNSFHSPISNVSISVEINCNGHKKIGDCEWTPIDNCDTKFLVGIYCKRPSLATCPRSNSVPFRKSCYEFVSEPKLNFLESRKYCRSLGSTLLTIEDEPENIFISSLLSSQEISIDVDLWLDGIRIPSIEKDKYIQLWYESQLPILYSKLNSEYLSREQGLLFRRNTSDDFWSFGDLRSNYSFICKSEQENIGCLDDYLGVQYVGTASRGENGDKCLPWNTPGLTQIFKEQSSMNHGYCRNSDGAEETPICFTSLELYDACDIPKCSDNTVKRGVTKESCSSSCPSVEQFMCKPGECIFNKFVCDGDKDCSDGEDEKNCIPFLNYFRAEPGYKLASEENSINNVTLSECAKRCVQTKYCTCSTFSYNWSRQKCLLSNQFSNTAPFDALLSRKSWNYYISESFLNNTGCRRIKRPANTPIEGIRLNSEETADVVEVKINGSWGGICDDGFSFNEAHVICRQLGFELGAERVVNGQGKTTDLIFLHDIECYGNETSISDCKFDDHFKNNHPCAGTEKAGLICRKKAKNCEEFEFHCNNKECINVNTLCDGVNNCKDGSDEMSEICSLPLQIRLVGGESENSGRVEIRHKGIWGTVCDDFFGPEDAKVFCKMMDLGSTGAHVYNGTKSIRGSGPIWIRFEKGESCSGNEMNIEQCKRRDLWNHDHHCSHEEDIGIVCQNLEDYDEIEITTKNNLNRTKRGPKSQEEEIECGKIRINYKENSDIKPKIAGGSESIHGLHPWQASIRVRGRDATYHWCGATIISRFHVITAAHCLKEFPRSSYIVRVGDFALRIQDSEEAEFFIQKIDFHPNYNIGPYLNNDIALVHIRSSDGSGIKFGKFVGAICLPSSDFVYESNINVTISGWGKVSYDGRNLEELSNNGLITTLQEAQVPIISKTLCKSPSVYTKDKLSSGMFCAGYLDGNGPDACQGDSGGPAVLLIRGRYNLLGITSWGYGCGRINKPGVYTKVSQYNQWIKRQMNM